jgi:rare lipoprotein A
MSNKDSGPSSHVDLSDVKDAIPKVEPKSPYGNPPQYEQDGVVYKVLDSAKNFHQQGIASWYGTKFHGERTSSGETYDMYKMTAAHKTLPLPTYARVTNLANNKSVTVKINDRGPFKEGRIIDLSYAAAVKLGYHKQGTTRVKIETIVPAGTHQKVAAGAIPNDKQVFVQVGAFSQRQKAQRLVKAIQSEVPWPVKISSVRVSNKRLFRVRIGPVSSIEQANKLVDTLSLPALGKPKIIYL